MYHVFSLSIIYWYPTYFSSNHPFSGRPNQETQKRTMFKSPSSTRYTILCTPRTCPPKVGHSWIGSKGISSPSIAKRSSARIPQQWRSQVFHSPGKNFQRSLENSTNSITRQSKCFPRKLNTSTHNKWEKLQTCANTTCPAGNIRKSNNFQTCRSAPMFQ